MRSDPTGEILQEIVVGAAIGGIVSAICEAVSGGSFRDVAIAFAVGAGEGAISTLGKPAKIAVVALETIKTVYDCRQEGVSWGKSLLAGGTTLYSSLFYSQTGDLLADTVCDLTLGLGVSLISNGTVNEIIKGSSRSTPNKTYSGGKSYGTHYVSDKDKARTQINPYIISTSPR